jgi:hypothetical protein
MPDGASKAINKHQHPPQTITLDGYAASHRAVRELKADGSLPTDTEQRSSKYLNNLIEQDHRSVVKQPHRRDAWLQVPSRSDHDRRHRADASHPQGAVRAATTVLHLWEPGRLRDNCKRELNGVLSAEQPRGFHYALARFRLILAAFFGAARPLRPEDMWTVTPNAVGTSPASSLWSVITSSASTRKSACRNRDRRCDLPTLTFHPHCQFCLRWCSSRLFDTSKRADDVRDQSG